MIDRIQTITTLDLVIIGAYLAFMLGIGIWFIRRIKGETDFYVAGRSLGTVVMMATVCATIVGGSAMMGRAAKAYSEGFVCIMTALPYLFGMLAFSAYSGRIHQIGLVHNITSIPELVGRRFGKTAKIFMAVLVALAMMGTVAAQISATATIIKMVGGNIGLSFEAGAVFATVIFIIYTAASGLFGVVYTDVVQFFMLLVFVYIMIPARAASMVGGLGNFWRNLDKDFITPHLDWGIVSDIIAYLVFTMAGAEMWQRAFAAKDRKTAKKGMLLGTCVYACTLVLIFFMGLAARQLLPNVEELYGTNDAVIPALAINILPAGLTGLALAGMLSVIMSSADSCLLVAIQTCVHDIGMNIFPDMGEKKEIFYSRIFAVLLAAMALLVALGGGSVYAIITSTFAYYASAAGLPAFAALYWKKATAPGMLCAMAGGLVTALCWNFLGCPLGLGPALPGTAVCAVLLFGVSLLTRKRHPSVVLEIS